MTWDRIKDATQDGRGWVNDKAEVVVEKLQEVTGLKLKETLGWAKAEVEIIENKALDMVRKVEENEIKVTLDKNLDGVSKN